MFIPLFLLSGPGGWSGSRKRAEGFRPVRSASLIYLLWISLVYDKLLVLVIFAHVYITLVLLQLFLAARILIWSGSAFACSKHVWRFYWCLLWGWWDGKPGDLWSTPRTYIKEDGESQLPQWLPHTWVVGRAPSRHGEINEWMDEWI